MRVRISMDNVSYTEKPSGWEIPQIKKRTARLWQEIELRTLAELNGNRGHAIIPARLEGGIASDNCTGMQVFALDFDGGCSFESIRKKCDRLGLDISYAYHTFSSSEEKEKFRAVFVCGGLTEDRFIIRLVLQMLQKIFPECDHSCKDESRMFFGGKELIYFNENARLALVQLLPPLMEALDVGNHYMERLRDFTQKTGVLLQNGHPVMGQRKDMDAVYGENEETAVIHMADETSFSPFFAVERKWHRAQTCKQRKKRRIKFREGDTQCRLYHDFVAGEKLDHDMKFAIITNLLQINGGTQFFLDKLKEIYGMDSCMKWKKEIRYMKGYHPKRCSEDFCPYYGMCENRGTMADTMAVDRRVYMKDVELFPIEEVWECFRHNLERAFRSADAGIHLIRAQTGLGKTQAYIRLMVENPEKRFVVALPTNMLKEEVAESLRDSGIPEKEIFVTASVHSNPFVPDRICNRISDAHNRGIHNGTGRILNEFYQELKNGPLRKPAVEEECRRILSGIDGIRGERIVVTTHAYLMQMEESFLKNHTVIIDEDILQLQIFNRMYQVSEACLEELEKKKIPGYSDIASGMLRTGKGEYQRMEPVRYIQPLSEEELGGLEQSEPDDNVNDLACAGAFIRMRDRATGKEVVKYFCPSELPRMKYIILSATFSSEIYSRYFGRKMPVYTYQEKKAAYRGHLQQYTCHSLGRTDLQNRMEIFPMIRRMTGNPKLDIITFKMFEGLEEAGCLNSAGIHFGNSTGVNSLSGKDLAIIGTPYKADEYYKLLARYLGENVNGKGDKRPALRRVEYQGNSFLITTYRSPLLKEIQLHAIGSELEQCVGRARLLRNDCMVYVFSAFPCEQAGIHMGEYMDRREFRKTV